MSPFNVTLSRIVCLLCSVIALTSSVFSQSTTITAAEFEKAWKTALEDSQSKAVQVTANTLVDSDGKIITTDARVEQLQLPNRARSLVVITSGARSWKRETIEIGDLGYERTDSGKWRQYPVTERVQRITVSPNILPQERLEREPVKFSVTPSILDGQNVRLYAAEMEDAEDSGSTWVERDSVWVSAEGLILKTENMHQETIKSNVWIKRTVSIWSYDPFGFEIEAPIKNK